MLRAMENAVNTIRRASQSSLPAGVVGFVDDIYVYFSDKWMVEAAVACTDLIRANHMVPKRGTRSTGPNGTIHRWPY